MLRINDDIAIPDWELTESFVRASGPGGQNVNKLSTAVQLRFAAERSAHLAPEVKARLKRIAGWRWTGEGEVLVGAERHRTQAMNREDARAKLREMILSALRQPKLRRPTRPTKAAIRRRLDAKAKRGSLKAGRRPVAEDT